MKRMPQETTWANGPGDRYGWHDHGYHKSLVCLEGGIVFHTPGTGHLERVEQTRDGRTDGRQGPRDHPANTCERDRPRYGQHGAHGHVASAAVGPDISPVRMLVPQRLQSKA